MLLLCSSCSRREPAAPARLAIPPLENLTGDRSLEWMSRAAQEVLASDLSRSSSYRPLRVSARREAPPAGATHVLHGAIETRGARLRLAVSIEDLRTNRISKTYSAAGPSAGGVLCLADELAHQLDTKALRYSTQSEKALEEYAKGLAAHEPADKAASFERAVAADPDFGDAYVAWAESLAAGGDQPGVRRVLTRAGARGARIDELSRSRLGVIEAGLGSDAQQRLRALEKLSRKTPDDVRVLRSLARAQSDELEFAAAAVTHRRLAAIEGQNPLAWNELGYAEAFAGNLDAAVKALRRYAALAPGESNPMDSLGDVFFYFGRFADAEKNYLEAHRNNPRFLEGAALYKAARARLMTGDVAGANELFRRFQDARLERKDPLLPYREAQWLYLTGRRREAVQVLERFVSATPLADAASLGFSQLAAWSLGSAQALDHAARAASKASSAPARSAAALVGFLARPAPPSQIEASATRVFPGPGAGQARSLALALKLLLDRRPEQALPPLTELRRRTHPAFGEPIRTFEAWALVELGRGGEALRLLETHRLPQQGAESVLFTLAFPRSILLRAQALEMLNRPAEARSWRDLHRRLSGEEPAVPPPGTR